jgi:hypothetical protein
MKFEIRNQKFEGDGAAAGQERLTRRCGLRFGFLIPNFEFSRSAEAAP